MATVVVERLPPGDYAAGCVALGPDYGSPEWEGRPEVAAIRKAVFDALDGLDARAGASSRVRGRRVLVKPNLVAVYRRMGLEREDYPESTDPRVLDAVVLWLSRFASAVDIVESSGRAFPTRGAFRVSGIDRLARRRGCGLVALDEEPADRYFLPKARVHREVLVPRAFAPVIRGEAAYVSVPKMKTNLYTGVTLGFKNAMGTIPYNLRQRDHNRDLDRKLVELLYLFKPDLVLIDGVVGGEGECPAPVDPVDSRLIVAGDHPVETDRAATALMGFDPASIGLLRVADELGFGDPAGAQVVGDPSPVAFRPADASLVSERARRAFPMVRALIGLEGRGFPDLGAPRELDPSEVRAMESYCRGGCVASARFALAMMEAEGVAPREELLLVLGPGRRAGGARLWFDADGRPHDTAAIAAHPAAKLVVGSCGEALAPIADRYVAGCMPLPNAPHAAIHDLGRAACKVASLANPSILPLALDILGQRAARRRHLKAGRRLDVAPRLGRPGKPSEAEPEPAAGPGLDWVEWPLPPLGPRESKELQDFEDDAAVAGLRGVFVPRVRARAAWRAAAMATGALTAGLPAAALASLASGAPVAGLGWRGWLVAFGAVELVHLLELAPALAAAKAFRERAGGAWGPREAARAAALALLVGFPSWVPKGRGVFD